jgi:hypothetical protein
MKFREYKATPDAIRQGRAIGLFEDTAKRLSGAARRSAQFTSEYGNRRFGDFVLTVENDQIVWVDRLNGQAA